MRVRFRKVLKDNSGVAMVTVLLVGASLTVVGSAAAFATIAEFRSGSDDRKALAALSYAESGIDRMISHLKTGLVTYNDMNTAGCSKPPLTLPVGNVGVGSYSVSLTVYNPDAAGAARFPIPPTGGACANRPINANVGQGNHPNQTFFVVTSTGEHPDATRTVRQVIIMEPIGLPVGIYATNIDVNSANHDFHTVSMVSRTQITHRTSVAFIGNDPYYLIEDFFPAVTGRAMNSPVPAAAHAAGTIYQFHARDAEFRAGPKNCAANGTTNGGVSSQSLWDSDGSATSGAITSGCEAPFAPQTGWPSTSKFTQEQLQNFAKPEISEQDHQSLREAAQRYGVYCSFPGFGGIGLTNCIQQGVDKGATGDYAAYIAAVTATTPSFVAYFDFRAGAPTRNNLVDIFNVWGCNDDPALNRSVVAVVRNGGINWPGTGGKKINGALIMDGDFTAIGNFTFNGSIIVKGNLNINSATQRFSVDPCWVKNMPGPFLRTIPSTWSEVDR